MELKLNCKVGHTCFLLLFEVECFLLDAGFSKFKPLQSSDLSSMIDVVLTVFHFCSLSLFLYSSLELCLKNLSSLSSIGLIDMDEDINIKSTGRA